MHGIAFAKIYSSLLEYAWDTVSHNPVQSNTLELTLHFQGHIHQIWHFLSYNLARYILRSSDFVTIFFFFWIKIEL